MSRSRGLVDGLLLSRMVVGTELLCPLRAEAREPALHAVL